jgi:hypothetical protein
MTERIRVALTVEEVRMLENALLHAGVQIEPAEFRSIFGVGRNDLIPLRRRLSALAEVRSIDPVLRYSLAEASERLAGAVLRPSTVRLGDGDFRIDGELDASVGKQLGRYRIRVRIRDVDGYDLRDRAQSDTIVLREFVPVPGGVRFASKVLTEVVVRRAGSVIEVIRASAPFMVRRFLRWRFESDAPGVYVHEAPS